MKKIMSFNYYSTKDFKVTYTIYETSNIPGKKGYLGYTDYITREIVLEDNTLDKMVETLKHELVHVWLEENGYEQDRLFNVEEMCDIVSYCNNFINGIVEKYKEIKKEKII